MAQVLTKEIVQYADAANWLGHTQKQGGGSTLQAGGRAILIPSKITTALSTLQGRAAARTMLLMGVSKALMNYTAMRPFAMMESIRRALPAGVEKPLVVDPAGGYSPQLIWLAEEMPNVEFVEIDLPRVIRDKKRRLSGFHLPPNIRFVEADLSNTMLHEALDGQKPHVVITLAAYLAYDKFTNLLHYLQGILAEGGAVVAPFPYAPGVDDLARNSRLFRRFAGEPAGIVNSEDEIRGIMTKASFKAVTIYKFSDIAKDLEKPIPADIEIVAIARR